MPRQIIGAVRAWDPGHTEGGGDRTVSARVSPASAPKPATGGMPADWGLNQTALRCPDGAVGLLVCSPAAPADDRVGVQVPGEEDVRWIPVSQAEKTEGWRVLVSYLEAYGGQQGRETAGGMRDCALLRGFMKLRWQIAKKGADGCH